MKPLCELSLIVAVSSGPGIMAPEKAMIKEETKIVINSHTVYIRPISKDIESFETFALIISFPAG
jgi:short-subunit dehydrogenase involved in D-alanine esterification of teichoic acids